MREELDSQHLEDTCRQGHKSWQIQLSSCSEASNTEGATPGQRRKDQEPTTSAQGGCWYKTQSLGSKYLEL